MGALETAKEIGRMTATATLGKDVIDLLKEKVALLAEQITTLETENAQLKTRVKQLEKQPAAAEDQAELDDDAIKFLKLMFEHSSLRVSQIAATLGISKGMAEYHRDVLYKKKMIGLPAFRTIGQEAQYHILPPGREYLVKNRLV